MKREKSKLLLYHSMLLELMFYAEKLTAVFSRISNQFVLYHILTDKDYKT